MISEIIFGGMTIGILSLIIIFGTHFLVANEKRISKVQKLFFLHPNTISFLRIPIGGISLVLFHYEYYYIALIIFTFAVFSDYSDGVIARACNLETELGKSLDPMADKIVYFLPLLYFGYMGKINMILVIVFILIDSIGQFSRIFLKKIQKETKANSFGKVKTTLVFIFLFYFFLLERFFILPSIISSIFLILFSLLAIVSILRKII
ncbi:CDP-alcohol phosphatidyltransferase family protein [Candidatus Gracilibacteria bacterium]|nr:CDP-alcohol phosphatidyltransferase family protein [Candidatus Gracilibacteria bacterium]NUJ99416.1 CDP-alcohol phosphatidyltransferase family protein [Candidatus Gracilibacteria bacterium]